MNKTYLASLLTFALMSPVHGFAAENANNQYSLPVEVAQPDAMNEPADASTVQNVAGKILGGDAQNSQAAVSNVSTGSPAVNQIMSTLSKGFNNQPAGVDQFGRPTAPAMEQSKDAAATGFNRIYQEAQKQYKEVQNVTVKTGGNIILPVSKGLQNLIHTNFKSASVSTADTSASITIDGPNITLVTNSEAPIGLMISEEGAPETTYNLTLIPLDVPGAMISINTPITSAVMAKREKLADDKQRDQLLERSNSEDLQDIPLAQDDYKQRVMDILTPVANGEVPSGFSLQTDRLNRIPATEQSPCKFNFYAKLGQRMVGSREIIDVILVDNDTQVGQLVSDQLCSADGVIATAIFDKAFLRPGEQTEVYILRDKLYQERTARITTRPRLAR